MNTTKWTKQDYNYLGRGEGGGGSIHLHLSESTHLEIDKSKWLISTTKSGN